MPALKLTSRQLWLAVMFFALTALSSTLFAGTIPGDNFLQHNLVSDIPGMADHLDPDLVNPWGISMSSTSPFWISDNGMGKSTLYNGSGVKQGLVVTVPPPPGGSPPSAPTGQVFNGNSSVFGGSRFIFATEDGTIAGWSGGTSAAIKVDNSVSGAVYKGLALGTSSGNSMLYAANFHAGTVDVFDSNFNQVSLGAGAFVDPTLPSGYAPFNVQDFGGRLYVTYALQDAQGHDDVPGAGHGFIDVYDTNGNLIGRLVSGGELNSPWGMAIAPSKFGKFGGDLLVGNFGDGTINAFDPMTGTELGTLDFNGNPIVNEGLWGLTFGNGGAGGDPNVLYFTAGIPGPTGQVEDHGLFASLTFVPEPGSLTLLAFGFLGVIRYRRHR